MIPAYAMLDEKGEVIPDTVSPSMVETVLRAERYGITSKTLAQVDVDFPPAPAGEG